MSEIFTNLARSTLASGITAGALSLTVQSGDGNDLFPSPGGSDNFRCILFKKSTGDIEIINVTSRTADVLTITRAHEDIGNLTAAAFAFDAGDLIELRPTSDFFNSLAAGATSTNIQHGTFLYGADTGGADAYTIAMNPTATALDVGQEVRVLIGASNTNTGIAATLKIDGLTAHPITMEGGGNPPANSIRAGFVHTFNWDGTSFIFKSVGLVLTSTGLNALGKQIKNVAAGTAASDASTIGLTETLVLKTLTTPIIDTPAIDAPQITGIITGSSFLDEDDMVSDDDKKLASQQSIKAYVDTEITASKLVLLDDPVSFASGLNDVVAWSTATVSAVPTGTTKIIVKSSLSRHGISWMTIKTTNISMLYARSKASTLGAVGETTQSSIVIDTQSAATGNTISDIDQTEFTINLDGSKQFEYAVLFNDSIVFASDLKLWGFYLVGYWI